MSFASLRLGPRVPAARAPHARPPPCYLRLARVMKAPPRPLSQKRAAEGLQGRVRRARVYVLSPAAGAARRSTPLPLRGPRASLERFTHYSDGFYGVFLPENVQNPCCSVAVKKESIPSLRGCAPTATWQRSWCSQRRWRASRRPGFHARRLQAAGSAPQHLAGARRCARRR
jgi:hypothetical protein